MKTVAAARRKRDCGARLLTAAALVMAAGLGASCGEEKTKSTSGPTSSGPSSVTRPAKPGEKAGANQAKAAGLTEAAANLQSLYETLGQQPADVAESPGDGRGEPAQARAASKGNNGGAPGKSVQGPSSGAVAIEPGGSTAFQPAAATARTDVRKPETIVVDKPLNRAELSFRLADRIRGEAGWSPQRQAAAMLGLEMIEPGVGGPQFDDVSRRLSPESARALAQLRKVLSDIASSESIAGDPASLSTVLSTAAKELAPPPAPRSLELGSVAMCTRVESFGRFTPYPAAKFVAGRGVPIIVYTEVKNFDQRPAVPAGAQPSADPASPGAWSVELGQELTLYFDSDGSKQWHQAMQTVRDVARSKRSDYYLVQRIDLPANLSVGRYNLKVLVRDQRTGQEVERALPLEIVADAKLTKTP